jgi:hypothetical protein
VINSLIEGIRINELIFEHFSSFFYISSIFLRKYFKEWAMETDRQLKELFGNFEKLEDDNKDKLLKVGENLLNIKSLVQDDKLENKTIIRISENEKLT